MTSLRILIVDDSKTVRQSAEAFLTRAGYEVRSVDNGLEAFPAIFDFKPRVIFMDVMMPRLNGYHSCTLIKTNPALQDIAVIMLSGKEGLIDMARGQRAGVDAHLSKPFTESAILSAVASVTRNPTSLPEKEYQ